MIEHIVPTNHEMTYNYQDRILYSAQQLMMNIFLSSNIVEKCMVREPGVLPILSMDPLARV